MLKRLLGGLALALCLATPALGQSAGNVISPSGNTPTEAMAFGTLGGPATPVDPTHPLPATDSNNAAFSGVTAMTVGTTYTAGRSIGAICTVAGTATFTMADASSLPGVPLAIGFQTFPLAVIVVASTTATCTFYEMK